MKRYLFQKKIAWRKIYPKLLCQSDEVRVWTRHFKFQDVTLCGYTSELPRLNVVTRDTTILWNFRHCYTLLVKFCTADFIID